MCVSAPVSFAAGTMLVAVGALFFKKYDIPRKYWMLAGMVPVLGLHQIIEGFVWLGIENRLSESIENICVYLYNFIALSLWPSYVPLTVYVQEGNKILKRCLWPVMLSGFAISIYISWGYLTYGLRAEVTCCTFGYGHISYNFYLPYLLNQIHYIYLFAAVTPFFITTHKKIRYILGPVYLVSFPVAYMASRLDNFPSVWCLLAAIISLTILYVIKDEVKLKPRLLHRS